MRTISLWLSMYRCILRMQIIKYILCYLMMNLSRSTAKIIKIYIEPLFFSNLSIIIIIIITMIIIIIIIINIIIIKKNIIPYKYLDESYYIYHIQLKVQFLPKLPSPRQLYRIRLFHRYKLYYILSTQNILHKHRHLKHYL